MRQLLAVVVGVLVAVLGALIVGEYDMSGLIGVVAGVVFGIAIAEAMAAAAGNLRQWLLGVAAVTAGAGFLWGLWISTGRDFRYATVAGWIGVAAAAVSAPWWLRSAARRGQSSPPAPARTADDRQN